ncbi:hypothetical protein [Haloparvum sedimenti]|uniref:hypothetical protein n=1 Tax=Haloparvum sedimenti TaxID=1678448 RepID=UPI00071E6A65|nr:hypothetical protein [Haloparvum sedimenti]
MTVEALVVSAQTGALIAVGVLIAYPVVRNSTNVAYTLGMVLLSVGFFALAASYGVGLLVETQVPGQALSLVAALLGTAGVARFARPFVRIDGSARFDAGGGMGRTGGGERDETETDGTTGGFGDAKGE